MGKTNRPLRILVVDAVPVTMIEELTAKGHSVTLGGGDQGDARDYDLILGSKCARFVPGMEKYLDSMIKGARAVKFGKKAE